MFLSDVHFRLVHILAVRAHIQVSSKGRRVSCEFKADLLFYDEDVTSMSGTAKWRVDRLERVTRHKEDVELQEHQEE